MTHYYFLSTLLPALKIGTIPEISSRELDFFLRLNLSKNDLEEVYRLRRFIDIQNIRQFWLGKPFILGGNFDEFELEEALVSSTNFPEYVFEFIETYPDSTGRSTNFDQLLECFFKKEQEKSSGFIRDYLEFEWQYKYITSFLRAKTNNIATDALFSADKLDDPFIDSLYQSKDSQIFEFNEPFSEVAHIFYTHHDSPFGLYKAIQEWRFEKIEELIQHDVFSFRRILAYVIQLQIVEEWLELDKMKGLEVVQSLTQNEIYRGI